jgi:hypothetical protein
MLDCKLDWYPHKQYLENKLMPIRINLVHCSKATWGMSFHNLIIYKYAIIPAITYVSETWSISVSKRAKSKLQQIQRSSLIFIKKAYKTVSTAGAIPNELAMRLYKDVRAISIGNPTNAVIFEFKKIEIEIPTKIRGIHAKDNHIRVDL